VQAHGDRQHEAQQAEAERGHSAVQAELDRSHNHVQTLTDLLHKTLMQAQEHELQKELAEKSLGETSAADA
jgi:hypothetical protein